MKKSVLFIAFSLLIISCPKGPGVYDANIDIYYKTNTGNNLLDDNVQNHYSRGQIRFFNLINGRKYELYRNILINTDSLNNNYISLAIEADTTILQLNESISDTIVCQIDRSNGISIKKVWYNRLLKWESYAVPRVFTILK